MRETGTGTQGAGSRHGRGARSGEGEPKKGPGAGGVQAREGWGNQKRMCVMFLNKNGFDDGGNAT